MAYYMDTTHICIYIMHQVPLSYKEPVFSNQIVSKRLNNFEHQGKDV